MPRRVVSDTLDAAHLRDLEAVLGPAGLAAHIDEALRALPASLAAVEAGHRAGDLFAWATGLHSLKGASGLIGAVAVVRACIAAERAWDQGAALSGLRAAWAATEADMRAWRTRLTADDRTGLAPLPSRTFQSHPEGP